ncbi:MAG: glycerol-3-phosphate acyltransferase [Lachnospiraceae bacterium]|nr:glycerol-3-phosphate acyltransferase [Lachnospiraceae bacterium]
MAVLWRMVCIAVGYLFGNFLTAEAVAKLAAGKSADQIGTGNPGMANIMANLGKKAGLLVLAGDAVKTLLAVAGAYLLAGNQIGRAAVLYAGIGAICGHNYPVWKKGRGGKGVTVTCVWLICCFGIPGVLCSIAGGAAVMIWRSLALGAVIIPFLAVIPAFWISGAEGGILVLLSALMMVSRHITGLREFILKEDETHTSIGGE